MSNLSFLLITLIFLLSLYNSIEKVNNSSENTTETKNNRTETDYTNSFDNYDFGNLIWLDDTNSTSEIKKHELLYIIFYSPYSIYSRMVFPEFILTSKYAEEKKLPVKFAKIDSSKSPNTSQELNVRTTPTVMLIYKGERTVYEGDPKKEGLLKLMNKKLNDDIYKFETLSEIKKHVDNASSIVILSTLKDKNSTLYRSFLKYAKKTQNLDFISCISEECLNEYKENIVLFKQFDEKINKYTEEYGSINDAKINSVKEFIGTYGVENGGSLNRSHVDMMSEHKKAILFYFRNSSLEEHTKYDKLIKELGKELRKKDIYTVVSDIKGDTFQTMTARTFIIVKQDLPLILFYDTIYTPTKQDLARYYTIRQANSEKLNKEYIKEYLHQIMIGNIKKDLYSEEPLDNYDINGLKYVIGRTFDKEVIECKNNVFFAIIDGSGYNEDENKIFLRILRKLSDKYLNDDKKKVVFAYTDGTKNQVRDLVVRNDIPPICFLYTNAMPEKNVIKMNIKNRTALTEVEIEDFLYEKLNWGNRTDVENKKEEKKDTQTDL